MAQTVSGRITLPGRTTPKPAAGEQAAPGARPLRINIATPCYGSQFSAAYVTSVVRLISKAPAGVEFAFTTIDYADVVVARNWLISTFYYKHPDCDWLLFLDDDMGFEPQLIGDMIAQGKDVVGAVYAKRRVNLEKLHAAADDPFDIAYAKACEFIGAPVAGARPVKGFLPVTRIGTGILLISRKAVTRMIECLPEIVQPPTRSGIEIAASLPNYLTPFDKVTVDGAELSEDFSFCHRWVQGCGGEIVANVTHRIRHVGELTVNTAFGPVYRPRIQARVAPR
jgi:hypothetical protein